MQDIGCTTGRASISAHVLLYLMLCRISKLERLNAIKAILQNTQNTDADAQEI
jgi:hypothetical protein